MALLIYAGVVFLLGLSAVKKQSRLLLLLLQVQSFLFVFGFFWITRSNYQILQIRKIGYQFEKVTNDFRSPAREILIGGDQQKDDVFVSDLPAGAVHLIPAVSSPQVEMSLVKEGLFVTKNSEPLNIVYLKNGDRLGCGNQEIMFESKGAFDRRFVKDGKEWKWPRKEWRMEKEKQPLFSANFDSRLYSVSEILKSLGANCETEAAISMQQVQFSLSRNPLKMNGVVLIGAGNQFRLNGAIFPNHFSFQDGDGLNLYSIHRGEEAVHLQSAASFHVKNGEALELILSSPQVLGIKEELLRNGSAVNKPLFLSTTTLPYSVFPTAHYAKESRRFSGLFAFVQTQQYSGPSNVLEQMQQRLQSWFLIRPGSLEIVTDQGSFRPAYGDRFALGQRDRMIFAIDKLDFPWVLLQMLCILWIAKMLFQPPFFAATENVMMQLLVITLDFFLITRFLFSFRASNLYPFSSESLTLSLFAILIVPYLLFAGALLVRSTWERRQTANLIFYSLIVCVLAAILMPNYLWLTAAAAIFFSIIALLRFHPRSFLPHLNSQGEIFRNVKMEIYLVLFLLMAVLLQLMGAGEAIQAFGIRFPLALIYHPILLFFSCYYLNEIYQTLSLEKNPENLRRAFKSVLKLGSVLVGFLVVSLLTSDFGFLLLYSVPIIFILFGLAARYIQEYELSWKGIGAVMAVPLVLFLTLFAGAGLIDKIVPITSIGNRTIQRVLLTVNPSVLENSGLLTAERQLGHQRTFVAYAHSGILGGGYMNRPISSALAGTALNDNVPAAFLLNDFGVLGFVAVLLILFLWILFWWRNHTGFSLSAFVSLAALMTFLYVDLYMMLSNCGIFLFTGKNVFFWGLNSVSDVFHSTLLVFLLTVKTK